MDWASNLKALAELSGDAGLFDDPDQLAIMPSCITSAENRIQRDLDLLGTRVQDDLGKLTANRKQFILPIEVGTFIVVEQVRVIFNPPPGFSNGVYGPPLLPTTKDLIDSCYPSETALTYPSIPLYWCPIDQATINVGPPPDQDYWMSVFGTMRFNPLGPQTGPTFLSTQLVDLYLAAEMIYISAFQRNWSARSDDPAMGRNWTDEYGKLLASAQVEEARKKLQSGGNWSSRFPTPLAAPATPAPSPLTVAQARGA
jgi:hypothetical protein